jgi:ATP-dependent RNA circularization protein (DNA/RNA ligase family)
MKNERLEKLSDDVRRGTAIRFDEALEVIAYQEELKRNRKLKPTLKRFFDRLFKIK